MSLWSKFLSLLGLGTKEEAIAAGADVEVGGDVGLGGIGKVLGRECFAAGLSISQLEGFDWQQVDSLVGGLPGDFTVQELNKVKNRAKLALLVHQRAALSDSIKKELSAWMISRGHTEYDCSVAFERGKLCIKVWPYGRPEVDKGEVVLDG